MGSPHMRVKGDEMPSFSLTIINRVFACRLFSWENSYRIVVYYKEGKWRGQVGNRKFCWFNEV